MTKAISLTIVLDNCKGDDEEEYTGAAARERDHRLRDSFGREPGEGGFGTGMQKRFRHRNGEIGCKCPRLIPVNGLEAGKVLASLSDKLRWYRVTTPFVRRLAEGVHCARMEALSNANEKCEAFRVCL